MEATSFTFPSATKTKAIIQLLPAKHFWVHCHLYLAAESHLFILFDGNAWSSARACKVRGATITEPSAEEMVDAASPSGTSNCSANSNFAHN